MDMMVATDMDTATDMVMIMENTDTDMAMDMVKRSTARDTDMDMVTNTESTVMDMRNMAMDTDMVIIKVRAKPINQFIHYL